MRAAVWYGPKDIRIEEVPIPEIGTSDLLLKVTASGLCKTDIKKIQGITLSTKELIIIKRNCY